MTLGNLRSIDPDRGGESDNYLNILMLFCSREALAQPEMSAPSHIYCPEPLSTIKKKIAITFVYLWDGACVCRVWVRRSEDSFRAFQ